MKSIDLTQEEQNLITEALLFSATGDMCSNWTKKDDVKLLALAAKIKGTTSNLYVMESPYDDDATETVVKDFNIPVKTLAEFEAELAAKE